MTVPAPRRPLPDAAPLLAAVAAHAELLLLDAALAPPARRPRDAGAVTALLRSLRLEQQAVGA